MTDAPMSLDQALALADHASPTPVTAQQALRVLRKHVQDMERDVARWHAIREMDGGNIYFLLGDLDGMHPERADVMVDAFLAHQADTPTTAESL